MQVSPPNLLPHSFKVMKSQVHWFSQHGQNQACKLFPPGSETWQQLTLRGEKQDSSYQREVIIIQKVNQSNGALQCDGRKIGKIRTVDFSFSICKLPAHLPEGMAPSVTNSSTWKPLGFSSCLLLASHEWSLNWKLLNNNQANLVNQRSNLGYQVSS